MLRSQLMGHLETKPLDDPAFQRYVELFESSELDEHQQTQTIFPQTSTCLPGTIPTEPSVTDQTPETAIG